MINSNGGTTWDNTIPTGTEWYRANNPCPPGWRVPNFNEIQKLADTTRVIREWITQNEIFGLQITDRATSVKLFLPAVGALNQHTGNIFGRNENMQIWSSTAFENESEDRAYAFTYLSGVVNVLRRTGRNIRCVVIN